jgi:hypothetical protein
MNKTANFEGLRVYGLLTDLTSFKFYSYDPTEVRLRRDDLCERQKRNTLRRDDIWHVVFPLRFVRS